MPFRVVVHKVIDWTIGDYWPDRPTDVAPEWFDPAEPCDGLGEFLDRDAVVDARRPRGEDAQVMELYYLERLEIDEIAEQLGMKRNAVDQALHRGHAKLREIFLA